CLLFFYCLYDLRHLHSFPTRRSSDLWPYVRRERPLIVVSLLALYAEIGLRLLEPWPLKVVLDHVVGAGHHGRWVDRVLATLDPGDRKSTRLNSSHVSISYAVFCLKKN